MQWLGRILQHRMSETWPSVNAEQSTYMVGQVHRLAAVVIDPDELAETLTVERQRILDRAQPMLDYQAAATYCAGPQFDHHGGRVDHRLEVGVLGLQHDRAERHVAHRHAGLFEPGHA